MIARRVALGLVATAVLAGCSSTPDPAPLSPSSSSPSSSSTTQPAAPTSASSSPYSLEDPSPVPQGPAMHENVPSLDREVPVWDAAAEATAITAAETFMRAFARGDLDASAWHAGISGLMTPGGADLFVGTDPENVSAAAVTGAGAALPSRSVYLAEIQVPTDAGTYLVTLSRTSADGPWLVEYTDLLEEGEPGA